MKPTLSLFNGQRLSQVDFDALLSALDQTALVSVTDAKGNILFANKRFIEVSKYALSELLGQNHRILKSGHQPDAMFIELWQSISSGKVWRGEIKNKAKDGAYYWVDTSIAPILDRDGKPERYISVRFLITDRKALEEKTQEQISDLEKMNKLMVGRELQMIELKDRIDALEKQSLHTSKK